MSPWASWTLLIGGAVLLLAPSIAVLLSWRPNYLARPGAPTHLLGAAGVVLYGAALTSEVPRLAEAPSVVLKACSYITLGLIGCAIVLAALYDFLAEPSRRRRR